MLNPPPPLCVAAVQPDAVPSLPGFILLHHAVTIVLLIIPFRRPHLHWVGGQRRGGDSAGCLHCIK